MKPEPKLYTSKTDETNSIDWFGPAERYVTALAAECAADRKAFYHANNGAERARGAIAAAHSLIRRLEPLNRS